MEDHAGQCGIREISKGAVHSGHGDVERQQHDAHFRVSKMRKPKHASGHQDRDHRPVPALNRPLQVTTEDVSSTTPATTALITTHIRTVTAGSATRRDLVAGGVRRVGSILPEGAVRLRGRAVPPTEPAPRLRPAVRWHGHSSARFGCRPRPSRSPHEVAPIQPQVHRHERDGPRQRLLMLGVRRHQSGPRQGAAAAAATPMRTARATTGRRSQSRSTNVIAPPSSTWLSMLLRLGLISAGLDSNRVSVGGNRSWPSQGKTRHSVPARNAARRQS